MIYSNIIIHAGGNIDNKCYTNSSESIDLNIKNMDKFKKNKMLLCELDCSKIKDGYIIAHDDCEKNIYNCDKNFSDISINEAKQLKIYKIFTPLFFSDLKEFINSNKEIKISFIIDSKHDLSDEYINYVIENMGNCIDKIIFQAYDEKDFFFIKKYNLKCLYALWKYNKEAYNEKIKKNINFIFENKINCIGISLFNYYYNKKKYTKQINLLLSHNIKLYIHGEINKLKCDEYLKNNLGIFSHYPDVFSGYI
jgi:hypothetical protein